MINFSAYSSFLLGFAGIALIIFSGMILRKNHHTLVFVLCYFWSLGFTIIITLGLSLIYVSKFKSNPEYAKNLSNTLEQSLHFMVDINVELVIIAAILVLLIVPQIISYFLSGFFGCASQPRLVSYILRYAFWSFVKSLALCSGAILAIVLGIILENGLSPNYIDINFATNGILAMTISFVLSLSYYSHGLEKFFADREGEKETFLQKSNRWLCRVSDPKTQAQSD